MADRASDATPRLAGGVPSGARVHGLVANSLRALRALRSYQTVATNLAVMGLAECGSLQKAELDREVDRLRAIDGGVHVSEVVRLPKEDFGADGDVFPQHRSQLYSAGRYGPHHLGHLADKTLVAGNPALQRINILIVRKIDDKVLGELVVYRRSGGDLPGPGAASRYSCPEGPDFGLERKVFTPGEN